MIDWHFDHSDNNESFRQAGAQILAQVNTRRRLSESHELLGMQLPPAPPGALPTQTFERTYEVKPGVLYEEFLDIGAFAPAHTDSDLFVRFALGDIIHLGDIFVNGSYPFIDAGTGGSMTGMLVATERALKMTNPQTRIVPGHGPLADRAALLRYRDMLTSVRDRVQKLKTAGRTAQEVVAAKPTADLDATWGKGFLTPDNFVSTVYQAL